MLDVLELQEEFVGVAVRPAAVIASVVARDGIYRHAVLLEEGERVVVQDLDGRDRYLRGVEPGPDVAGEAVEHRPDVASGRMTSSGGCLLREAEGWWKAGSPLPEQW